MYRLISYGLIKICLEPAIFGVSIHHRIVRGFNPHNMLYHVYSTGSHVHWTELILGYKQELVQNNNYNGNGLLKLLALFSLLNNKIIDTPACKLCLDAVLQAGRDSLVKEAFKTDV